MPVRHVVDILDEAYSREEPEAERKTREAGRRTRRREPARLQVDLDEAQAGQREQYRRSRPLGRLQGPRGRRNRDS